MKKGIAIFGKGGIIKTIQKEVKRRTITMTKRTTYTDGWHKAKDFGTLEFYVENGRLVKGLVYVGTPKRIKTVYPYEWKPECNCYSKVSGVTATYGFYKNYLWK